MSVTTNNTKEDILKRINFKCPVHRSDIGGLCSDMTCHDKDQMKCIKCISENSNCVNSSGHKFITIPEFTDAFFNEHYASLKSNYNTCRSVNNVENLCRNNQLVMDNFHKKRTDLTGLLTKLHQDFIDSANKSYSDFLGMYNEYLDQKEAELKQSLLHLNILLNFDTLEGFDINDLKDKMVYSPFDSLNKLLVMMKKTIDNIRNNRHKENEEICKGILNIKDEQFKGVLIEQYNTITSSMSQMFNCFKYEVQNELFKESIVEIPKISTMNEIYNDTIDYSTNSIFTDKCFEYYMHCDGNYYIAYPTSLHAIRIESFYDILSNDKHNNATSNPLLHLNTNVNARDKYLYFKLVGHLSRINKIIHHSLNGRDYLISSSNDQTIRLWDITDLANYKHDPNQYYTDENMKALKGHKSKVISLELFIDPLSSINFIISVALNDKVKIWDFASGEMIREIYDRNSSAKGSYEDMAVGYNAGEVNYLITVNNQSHLVKVWNFDTAKVLNVVQYPFASSAIVQCCYYRSKNKVILLDANGPCVQMDIRGEKEPVVLSMNLDAFKTQRIGCLFYEENVILIYTKNGMVYEYDLEETKFVDKKRIVDYTKGISWMVISEFYGKKMVLIHTEDQHLRVLGNE